VGAEEFLSLDEIERAKDVDYIVVPVPEWGGSIRLGSVNGEAKALFMEIYDRNPDAGSDPVWSLLAQCMVDGQGNRLIKTDDDLKRVIAILKRKDIRVTDRLVTAMFELVGIRTPKVPLKNDSSEEASASSPTPSPEAVAV
jgi:hypothetical protein